MDIPQLSVEKFRCGQACSQAVLSSYASSVGLDEQTALKISAGFAAGMRESGTCGAVTGAYMVLGMHAAGEDPQSISGRLPVYELVEAFSKAFKAENGTLNCGELLDCDISTPDGMQKAKDLQLFQKRCPKLVKDASEILEKLMEKIPTDLSHPH